MRIANLHNLTFLDISYANHVSDHGLSYFKEKHRPISKLFVNGLTSITSSGLIDIISTCKESLRILEATLMN